jgi:hypothetical protein
MKIDLETTRYLLKSAAELIYHHAPDARIKLDPQFFGSSDDAPCSGLEFCEILTREADSILEQSSAAPPPFRISGSIIQAGGEKEPTITISTSRRDLQDCTSIPFFKLSEITIIPF